MSVPVDASTQPQEHERSPLHLPQRPLSLLNGVPTRRCENGHPNDPEDQQCVICRSVLDPHSPIEDAQLKPIARFVVSNGPSFDIEGEIIVGRAPSGGARHLELSDPEVSRNHLLISTRGWQITIRDLGSANGSYLHRLNARSRKRIPDDRSIPVAVGDQLHLGRSRASILASEA